MGICSSTMCQPDNYHTQNEHSLKSALIKTLKIYQNQQWHAYIKDIIIQHNFRQIQQRRSLKSMRSTVRFSREDDGEEMEMQYNRFKNMTPEQKGQELETMLSKAYMIIDEEDMPHNNSKLLLPQLASRILFTPSMNINASIIGHHEDPELIKRRNEKLRTYDHTVLKSLEGFVKFCKEVQAEIFMRQSVFYSIILSFKSTIIQISKTSTQNKSNQNRAKLRNKVEDTCNKFIYFLIEAITLVYDIQRIQDIQKQKCFYTEINLYTLVASLLFNEKQFYDSVKKIYTFSMHKELVLLKQSPHLSYQKYPLPIEFSLDNKTLNYLKIDKSTNIDLAQKPLASLFKSTSISDEPYSKCVKMLEQLPAIKQPIGKLKLIYQIGLRINKEVERFYKNYYIPVPRLDGEKLLQIVRNILTRCGDENVIVEILITGGFIHSYYKMSKKGAYLTPFLVSIDESMGEGEAH